MKSRVRSGVLSSFWDDLVECGGDLPRLLHLIARRVAEVVGEGSVLTVVTGGGGTLDPVAAYHPDPDVLAAIREVVAAGPHRVGEGIVGRVAAERRSAVLNGLAPEVFADLVRPQSRAFAELHPIRALLVVPMVTAGEVVGTLGAMRTESDAPYDREDVLAVEAMAERAALAIADARQEPSALGAEEYEAIYRYGTDGMLFTVPDGRVLAANPAACEILGLTEAEICRRGRPGLLLGDDPATVAAVAERARSGRVRAEVPMRRGNGDVFVAEMTSAVFATAQGELRACVIFRDVSEQVALRDRLEQQARLLGLQSERDALTDLRNRRGFVAAAEEALAIAAREQKPVQLVFFDLDDLKRVNDRLGHRAGDDLIRRFAAAIGAETREADVSARIGGDEFVLLLFGASRADAEQVVDRVARSFGAAAPGEPIGAFSVGSAERSSGSTETLDELLERADRHMYERKVRRRFGSTGRARGVPRASRS